jgi:GH18 family chitinase
MKDSKNHFLMIDEVKMQLKKSAGSQNGKTTRLLQATVARSSLNGSIN